MPPRSPWRPSWPGVAFSKSSFQCFFKNLVTYMVSNMVVVYGLNIFQMLKTCLKAQRSARYVYIYIYKFTYICVCVCFIKRGGCEMKGLTCWNIKQYKIFKCSMYSHACNWGYNTNVIWSTTQRKWTTQINLSDTKLGFRLGNTLHVLGQGLPIIKLSTCWLSPGVHLLPSDNLT